MADVPLYPLIFKPFLRPMPWGGQRLARWVDVPFPAGERIGEAWLLSDHRLHASRITNGPLAGRTLHELMAQRSVELLGYAADRFPLLIKLLDAHENLSVQVHPDDEKARQWAPGEGGKTEAWVVLAAEKDAALYLGLKPGVDKTTLLRELATGNAPLCLQRYEPSVGESYFVPAGTIHALGGGLVVLEVQQTSDATFRLYDWGRVDAAGKPRAVHIEPGMACLKDDAAPRRKTPADTTLAACDYFTMKRRRLEAPTSIAGPAILFVIEGRAQLAEAGELRPGRLLFLPARSTPAIVQSTGGCELVEVSIPGKA